MSKVVYQLRGGAPDKIQAYHHPFFVKLLHMDFLNLVDMTDPEISKIIHDKEFILPADEGDIKRVNEYQKVYLDECMSWILLPQVNHPKIRGNFHIINYDEFVPKDSKIYEFISKETELIYMPYKTYSIDEFKNMILDPDNRVAYKTTTGSGSRGVLLIDPDRIHLGMKYREVLLNSDLQNFIDFAEKEKCKVMIQNLIPFESSLTKINVDFIMKDGELLSYKWDVTDPTAVFTNWNFGWVVRNHYTDTLMTQIAEFLRGMGIRNAIMNFEAFSDLKEKTYLVEFNWRWSNSTFEYQMFDIDPIEVYLYSREVYNWIPYGEHKFSRYWQCVGYGEVREYYDRSRG